MADLKSAIDAGIGFASNSDQVIYDWLHALTEPAPVSWADYMLWLSDFGGAKKMKVAELDLDEAISNAATLALIVAQAGQDLSLDRSEVRAALGPLVGPVFSTAERDNLLAKSDNKLSRWRGLGLAISPKLGHIAEARLL